jgi:hypothetical protein
MFWLAATKSVNSSLESNLEHEKLRSEALLSEKLLLEKDLEKMRNQLISLKGVNSDLDVRVNDLEMRYLERESELIKLRKQNASLADIKRQRDLVQKLQEELETELLSARNLIADLESQNQSYENVIARLQEQNSALVRDLNRAMFASIDHPQVQAVRGKKEKLTVRARKTNKLIADFEVPASLTNISYRILDPKGILMTDKHGVVASHVAPNERNILASASHEKVGDGLQKVRMEYLPKVKLESGVYTVEILNDNLYVGSLNVKLR